MLGAAVFLRPIVYPWNIDSISKGEAANSVDLLARLDTANADRS